MEKAQGSLEYLIIIAAVLAIGAVVVLFVTGSFGVSSTTADYSLCKEASSKCANERATAVNPECSYCTPACSVNGVELFTDAIALCKEGLAELIYEDSKGFCGNAFLNSGEECDGNLFNISSCGDLGFTYGVLSCSENCTIDTFTCDNQPLTNLSTLRLYSEFAWDVFAEDNLVYIPNYNTGKLILVNTTNKSNPSIIRVYTLPEDTLRVFVKNRIAYLPGGQSFIILNLTEINSPIINIFNISDPSHYILDAYVKDDTAFIVEYGTGIRILNISNFSDITTLTIYPLPEAVGILVKDDTAFLT